MRETTQCLHRKKRRSQTKGSHLTCDFFSTRRRRRRHHHLYLSMSLPINVRFMWRSIRKYNQICLWILVSMCARQLTIDDRPTSFSWPSWLHTSDILSHWMKKSCAVPINWGRCRHFYGNSSALEEFSSFTMCSDMNQRRKIQIVIVVIWILNDL